MLLPIQELLQSKSDIKFVIVGTLEFTNKKDEGEAKNEKPPLTQPHGQLYEQKWLKKFLEHCMNAGATKKKTMEDILASEGPIEFEPDFGGEKAYVFPLFSRSVVNDSKFLTRRIRAVLRSSGMKEKEVMKITGHGSRSMAVSQFVSSKFIRSYSWGEIVDIIRFFGWCSSCYRCYLWTPILDMKDRVFLFDIDKKLQYYLYLAKYVEYNFSSTLLPPKHSPSNMRFTLPTDLMLFISYYILYDGEVSKLFHLDPSRFPLLYLINTRNKRKNKTKRKNLRYRRSNSVANKLVQMRRKLVFSIEIVQYINSLNKDVLKSVMNAEEIELWERLVKHKLKQKKKFEKDPKLINFVRGKKLVLLRNKHIAQFCSLSCAVCDSLTKLALPLHVIFGTEIQQWFAGKRVNVLIFKEKFFLKIVKVYQAYVSAAQNQSHINSVFFFLTRDEKYAVDRTTAWKKLKSAARKIHKESIVFRDDDIDRRNGKLEDTYFNVDKYKTELFKSKVGNLNLKKSIQQATVNVKDHIDRAMNKIENNSKLTQRTMQLQLDQLKEEQQNMNQMFKDADPSLPKNKQLIPRMVDEDGDSFLADNVCNLLLLMKVEKNVKVHIEKYIVNNSNTFNIQTLILNQNSNAVTELNRLHDVQMKQKDIQMKEKDDRIKVLEEKLEIRRKRPRLSISDDNTRFRKKRKVTKSKKRKRVKHIEEDSGEDERQENEVDENFDDLDDKDNNHNESNID